MDVITQTLGIEEFPMTSNLSFNLENYESMPKGSLQAPTQHVGVARVLLLHIIGQNMVYKGCGKFIKGPTNNVRRVCMVMLAPMHENNILVYLVNQHSSPCWSTRVFKRLGPTKALSKDRMHVNIWQQL